MADPVIATAADVAVYLDAGDQELATDQVNLALVGAEASVAAELGWDPVDAGDRTYWVRGPQRVVVLPATYVTAVTLTTAPPVVVEYLDPVGVVHLDRKVTNTVVTYRAGWLPGLFPDAIRHVVIERAARKIDNPRGLHSWATGSESEVYDRTHLPATGAGAGDPRLASWVREVLA